MHSRRRQSMRFNTPICIQPHAQIMHSSHIKKVNMMYACRRSKGIFKYTSQELPFQPVLVQLHEYCNVPVSVQRPPCRQGCGKQSSTSTSQFTPSQPIAVLTIKTENICRRIKNKAYKSELHKKGLVDDFYLQSQMYWLVPLSVHFPPFLHG